MSGSLVPLARRTTYAETDPVSGGRGESTLADRERRVRLLEEDAPSGMCLCIFSGELDRLLAAFSMATSAAASGAQVSMFFTFWATAALLQPGTRTSGKTVVERMFGWLLAGGIDASRLSRFDMAGLGRSLMKREMRKKRVLDLQGQLDLASQLGVRVFVCSTSMQLMGIREAELIDYPDLTMCGAATFNDLASRASTSLFI